MSSFSNLKEFIYTIYLKRDSKAQPVCSLGAGCNPPEFLSPTCVVLSRLGPAWSSLAQDLHVSGRHESGIQTVPLPGTLACAAPR